MKSLILALKQAPIVYVTRDLERALAGVHLKNYFIITNSTPFAKTLVARHRNIILIKNKETLDTRELLEHPVAIRFLKTLRHPRIVVFKNTQQIEMICQKNVWELLNPKAALANRVEEKISQVAWLGALTKFLPPHRIQLGKNLQWQDEKYIVQFNRAHTGSGTTLIESGAQVTDIKKTFPNREVRVTKFIPGPAFTNNNVVWGKQVLFGNINYQITGLSPFTDRPFATIGNDWALPKQLMHSKQIKQLKQIATAVGKKLAKNGWKGLFGIDTILDEKTGQLFLIEINARQPASTTYESRLQKNKTTTFEAHLAALLGLQSPVSSLQSVTDGAQIVQRIKTKDLRLKITKIIIAKLKKLDLNVIQYNNTEPGSDWLRIQTKRGIMERHGVFNTLGKKIQNILSNNES